MMKRLEQARGSALRSENIALGDVVSRQRGEHRQRRCGVTQHDGADHVPACNWVARTRAAHQTRHTAVLLANNKKPDIDDEEA